eukprot:PhF_6_TR40472/c0_g1_i2/m.60500
MSDADFQSDDEEFYDVPLSPVTPNAHHHHHHHTTSHHNSNHHTPHHHTPHPPQNTVSKTQAQPSINHHHHHHHNHNQMNAAVKPSASVPFQKVSQNPPPSQQPQLAAAAAPLPTTLPIEAVVRALTLQKVSYDADDKAAGDEEGKDNAILAAHARPLVSTVANVYYKTTDHTLMIPHSTVSLYDGWIVHTHPHSPKPLNMIQTSTLLYSVKAAQKDSITLRSVRAGSPEVFLFVTKNHAETQTWHELLIRVLMAGKNVVVDPKDVIPLYPTDNERELSSFRVLNETPPIPVSFGTIRRVVHAAKNTFFVLRSVRRGLSGTAIEPDRLKFLTRHPYINTVHDILIGTLNTTYVLTPLTSTSLADCIHHGKGYVDEKVAKYYLSQMVLVVAFLHANGVILGAGARPSRWLLDERHGLQLINLGLETQFDTIREQHPVVKKYLPESLVQNPLSKHPADDWECLGIALRELTRAERPSPELTDCINMLTSRTIQTPKQILEHPFFAGVNWIKLYERTVQPPGALPKIKATPKSKAGVAFVETQVPSWMKRKIKQEQQHGANNAAQQDQMLASAMFLSPSQLDDRHAAALDKPRSAKKSVGHKHASMTPERSEALLRFLEEKRRKEESERKAKEMNPPFLVTHKFTARDADVVRRLNSRSPERIEKSVGAATRSSPRRGTSAENWVDAPDVDEYHDGEEIYDEDDVVDVGQGDQENYEDGHSSGSASIVGGDVEYVDAIDVEDELEEENNNNYDEGYDETGHEQYSPHDSYTASPVPIYHHDVSPVRGGNTTTKHNKTVHYDVEPGYTTTRVGGPPIRTEVIDADSDDELFY